MILFIGGYVLPRNLILVLPHHTLGLTEELTTNMSMSKLAKLNAKLTAHMDPTLSEIGYSSLLVSYLVKSARPNSSSAPKLRALYSMISDFRMFLRVYGTPQLLEWTLSELQSHKHEPFVARWIAYLEAVSSLLYQILEDIAYLSSKKVIHLSSATETKLWVVSCYFWAAYVQLEIIRLIRDKLQGKKNLLKPFMVNMFWLPLTVHWSSPTGVLHDGQVGFLGAAATLPGVVASWLN